MITTLKQVEELRCQFLSDKRIIILNNEIAEIYMTAIPDRIEFSKKEREAWMVYSAETEHDVSHIRSMIDNIIKSDYPEILFFDSIRKEKESNF